MIAEKWSIEFKDLDAKTNNILSQSIKSIRYANYKSALAGAVSISFNRLLLEYFEQN